MVMPLWKTSYEHDHESAKLGCNVEAFVNQSRRRNKALSYVDGDASSRQIYCDEIELETAYPRIPRPKVRVSRLLSEANLAPVGQYSIERLSNLFTVLSSPSHPSQRLSLLNPHLPKFYSPSIIEQS